ncbi:MAG: hypothetical protein HON53_20935 [Planctomycetaceae bacterium]|jgi:hypothetical protein|nr:hypothetical protein [Planctomycetaceae bacterium]MBT6154997.1 hypothetical protein [Planctomycetaceae bacterium]MBT6487328.1 hypothetical protein [Planctomycetaceae bacterium]MBT6493042.1 hypothetical protein [Planctomycetaceae bacterium]
MQDIVIGNLTFRIEHRTFGGDRGPAIRVFGEVEGRDVQLLRFDCFESDPHYHYDPTDKNVMFHLDRLTMVDPLEFSLSQIAGNAKAMIEKAGFAGVAADVDQAELSTRAGEIRQLVLAGSS